MNLKKNSPTWWKQSPLAFNRHGMTCINLSKIVLSKRHSPLKFHSKKKTRPSFRQTTRKDKRSIENNTLTLRKHCEVTFSTCVEYLDLLNSPDTKFNNITVYYDGLNHYA